VTKSLRIHELAEDELADAALWYEGKQAGLGTALLELADQAVELIRSGILPSNPVPGVTRSKNARRVLLRRFPYSIIFYEQAGQNCDSRIRSQ